MFSRIVVPLDGSSFAESALGPARMVAQAFGGTMLVVRAEHSTGLPFVTLTKRLHGDWEALDAADTYLHRTVSQLRADGFTADFALFVCEAGSGIARAAELSHADLIVMASHVRWALPDPEHAQPSVTLSVFARSRVPMFVCRTNANANASAVAGATVPTMAEIAGPDMPIVVPLDGSKVAEAALPYASALARAFGSYLVLTRVIEAGTGTGSSAAATGAAGSTPEEAEAAEYLQAVREEIAQSGGHAIAMIEHGVAVSGIESAWRRSNGGLIVMASHGASGPSHMFLGSVAARIIEEIEAPVFVIQPQPAPVTTAYIRRDEG